MKVIKPQINRNLMNPISIFIQSQEDEEDAKKRTNTFNTVAATSS